MNNNNRGNITALALCGLAGNGKITNYNETYLGNYAIRRSVFKRTYKKLFGKKPNVAKMTLPCQRIYKANNTFYVPPGDWSEDAYPTYHIKKIYKTGKVYKIILKNQRASDYYNSKYTIGTTVVRIKRSRKSSNGYIITGITYRMTKPLY